MRRSSRALVVGVALALLVSLFGATPSQAEPLAAASRFVALAPTRVLDTRTGLGVRAGIVTAGTSVDLTVTGAGGVPSTSGQATAVVLNVTATDTAGPGYVQVFPTGRATIGASSNLNVERAGQTIANLVVVPVGDAGKVSFYSEGGAHLLADVLGYFEVVPGAEAPTREGRFVPTAPTRLVDTRNTAAPGISVPNPGDTKNCTDFATWAEANRWFWYYFPFYGDVAKMDDGDGWPCENIPGQPSDGTRKIPADLFRSAANSTTVVRVRGNNPVPSTGMSAVVLNITAVEATPGFWQAIPTGGATAIGASSNLNITAESPTQPNTVVVPVGADGTVTIYSQTGGFVLVDVMGYFTDATAAMSRDGLFVPVRPNRLLDTRLGVGAAKGIVADRGTVTINARAASTSDITGATAVAAFLNVTATEAKAGGYVQAFPTGEAIAGQSSNLNVAYAGQTIPNAVFAKLSASGELSLYTFSSTHLLADVAGWFINGVAVG